MYGQKKNQFSFDYLACLADSFRISFFFFFSFVCLVYFYVQTANWLLFLVAKSLMTKKKKFFFAGNYYYHYYLSIGPKCIIIIIIIMDQIWNLLTQTIYTFFSCYTCVIYRWFRYKNKFVCSTELNVIYILIAVEILCFFFSPKFSLSHFMNF